MVGQPVRHGSKVCDSHLAIARVSSACIALLLAVVQERHAVSDKRPRHRVLQEALVGHQALEPGLVVVLQKCGSGHGTTLHAP